VVTAPVLDGVVFGVVDEAELDGGGGVDVGVKARGVGRSLFWVNANDVADCGANTIGTDNGIVCDCRFCVCAAVEGDDAGFEIDGGTFVVEHDLDRSASTFGLFGTFFQHGVHVLPVEHVVAIAPSLLIVTQVNDRDRFAACPVAVDELEEVDWVAFGNVDPPFRQPSHAVGGAGD
jgi:hypothetical protein